MNKCLNVEFKVRKIRKRVKLHILSSKNSTRIPLSYYFPIRDNIFLVIFFYIRGKHFLICLTLKCNSYQHRRYQYNTNRCQFILQYFEFFHLDPKRTTRVFLLFFKNKVIQDVFIKTFASKF